MQQSHTTLLHKESVRLLNMQLELLSKISQTPGLIRKGDADEKQSLDPVRLKQDIEILQGELAKLENLDMVLAVVGTMKSGKSTTNNAIVGLEVLPNRNRPMTALPTLIRHTPGMYTPVLRFKKHGVINEFIKEIREQISRDERQGQLNDLLQSDELASVVKSVLTGFSIADVYKDEQGIFEFLQGLNDLVRLASKLDLEFPFAEFKSTIELPVIEVEFQHLRNQDNNIGRLSLLDTPGPNEAGQLALKPMMKEQLRRASGVIAVLDYTQLKSESDADVRKELLEIAEVTQGRLSILVNKFDQKDRNSDGEAETKSLVANELLQGYISVDDVYPVSSRRAYLANRARTELALFGRLPSPEDAPWLEDFAEEGLGRRWKRDIDDAQKVQDAINDLWEDSLFELPLTNVVQRAHAQAALFAIDSAASKLVDCCNRTNNFLGVRENALKKSVEELQTYINDLKRQQQKTDELEKYAQEEVERIGSSVQSRLGEAANSAAKILKGQINDYFKEGRITAALERAAAEKARSRDSNGEAFVLLDFLRPKPAPKKSKGNELPIDFDPKSSHIEFDNKQSATDLLDKIFKSTQQLYDGMNTAMSKTIDKAHVDIKKQSDELENKAKSILDELNASMNDGGFELKLNLPKRKIVSIHIDNQKMLENMVAEESRSVRRERRSSGAWGTVCGWFNTSDWGWETYYRDETFYKIDLTKVRKQTLAAANNVFANANVSIEQDLIQPMQDTCKSFFVDLKAIIDEVRGDLIQGIADRNRSRDEQEKLSVQLKVLKRESHDSDGDIQELEKDTKKALTEQCEVAIAYSGDSGHRFLFKPDTIIPYFSLALFLPYLSGLR